MAVIEYIEVDTAPLPLGEDTQALEFSQNRERVSSDGTPPNLSFITKATDK